MRRTDQGWLQRTESHIVGMPEKGNLDHIAEGKPPPPGAVVETVMKRDFDAHAGEPQVTTTIMWLTPLGSSATKLAPVMKQIAAFQLEAIERARAEFKTYDDAITRARMIGVSKPHGKRYPDTWWDEIASVWSDLALLDLFDPTATLARESGIPVSTVSRWIAVCRERGLLDQIDEVLERRRMAEDYEPDEDDLEEMRYRR